MALLRSLLCRDISWCVCLRGLSVRRTDRRSPATPDSTSDPEPLPPRQFWPCSRRWHASCSGACRRWGVSCVDGARAMEIPDERIREDALSALDHKRGNTHGAALFWTLPHAREQRLLRLLVPTRSCGTFLTASASAGPARGRRMAGSCTSRWSMRSTPAGRSPTTTDIIPGERTAAICAPSSRCAAVLS